LTKFQADAEPKLLPQQASSPRLVGSFTALKGVHQEFADLAEEQDVDLFAETASKR